MERFELKISQYQNVLLAVLFLSLFIFLYLGFSQRPLGSPPYLPQLPSEFLGIDFSLMYIYLNIISFLGYIVYSFLLITQNIEKYLKKDANKFPPPSVILPLCLSGLGILITIWNAITEWNIIVMLQTATFFILGCILIIWVIIDARMNHIPLRMIFEEKPLIKPDPWDLNKNYPTGRRGGG